MYFSRFLLQSKMAAISRQESAFKLLTGYKGVNR